jgi:hypothetical protein
MLRRKFEVYVFAIGILSIALGAHAQDDSLAGSFLSGMYTFTIF